MSAATILTALLHRPQGRHRWYPKHRGMPLWRLNWRASTQAYAAVAVLLAAFAAFMYLLFLGRLPW